MSARADHPSPGCPVERMSTLPTKDQVRELADQVVSALLARPFSLEGIERVLAQARADVQFEMQRLGRGRRR